MGLFFISVVLRLSNFLSRFALPHLPRKSASVAAKRLIKLADFLYPSIRSTTLSNLQSLLTHHICKSRMHHSSNFHSCKVNIPHSFLSKALHLCNSTPNLTPLFDGVLTVICMTSIIKRQVDFEILVSLLAKLNHFDPYFMHVCTLLLICGSCL